MAGVVLNAALSAQMTEQTFRRAQAVYRLRTLSEAYGIDPREWMDAAPPPEQDGSGADAEEVVDVVEVFERERTDAGET